MNKTKLFILGLATVCSLPTIAQTFKGVAEGNRYDDGDQMKSEYVGWDSDLGKSIFIVDNGIYKMDWDGTALSTPEKDPAVVKSEVIADSEKKQWATDFNLMYGNSGSVYVDGTIYTIMSRDYQSTTDEELFAVRKWDAKTGKLLSGRSDFYPASANLESAGMSYNPKDGKVYGLFHLTEQALPEEITGDPDFFTDTDGDATATDAGYAICTIDLETMTVTPITPGLYYQNFVTFAINSEGRAFALTSGGSSGVLNADGKLTDIDGNMAGASLCEFDLTTGLMKTKAVQAVDPSDGSTYTEYTNIFDQGTGYASQYRRQSACFDKNNPNKMYWNGYYNSGKGINDFGSWSSLSDKEWRTNGKFDTALYEVDITTGEATRLSKITNRFTFSCLWVDGADPSDGLPVENGIESVALKTQPTDYIMVYTPSGQLIYSGKEAQMSLRSGMYIVKSGTEAKKILVK